MPDYRYYVRLPCDCEDRAGQRWIRWNQIHDALMQRIDSPHKLEKAIKSYNPQYASVWDFSTLDELFRDRQFDSRRFFNTILPQIINSALQLPQTVPTPIPLLRRNINGSVSLNQQQVACLLANAFLCTFPHRNTSHSKSEYSNYPTINFSNLYGTKGRSVIEKLKCICHYFDRVLCLNTPHNLITFQRRCIDPRFEWKKSDAKISHAKLDLLGVGKIEDGQGMLQVDFANRLIGGGILGRGSVQEEIRFAINPEMIVARLFTEALDDKEALLMIGCERFNSYRGYADTFEWAGDFQDPTPVDGFSRRNCRVVAIDALKYQNNREQFKEENIKRELYKAFCGFHQADKNDVTPVASGLWGCGIFNGHPLRSALIQLMACAGIGRDLVFHANGNFNVQSEVDEIYELLLEKDASVGQLYKILVSFGSKSFADDPNQLVEFIRRELNPSQSLVKKFGKKVGKKVKGGYNSVMGNNAIDGLIPPEANYDDQPNNINDLSLGVQSNVSQRKQKSSKREKSQGNQNDDVSGYSEAERNISPFDKPSQTTTQNDDDADTDEEDASKNLLKSSDEEGEPMDVSYGWKDQSTKTLANTKPDDNASLKTFPEQCDLNFMFLLAEEVVKFSNHHGINIQEMMRRTRIADDDQERLDIMSQYFLPNHWPFKARSQGNGINDPLYSKF